MGLSLFTGFYFGEYMAIIFPCLFAANVALISLTASNFKRISDFFKSDWFSTNGDYININQKRHKAVINVLFGIVIILFIISEMALLFPFMTNISNFSSEPCETLYCDDESQMYSQEFMERYSQIYNSTYVSLFLFTAGLIAILVFVIILFASYIIGGIKQSIGNEALLKRRNKEYICNDTLSKFDKK